MSGSREAVLARIREALQTAHLPDAVATLPPPAPVLTEAETDGRDMLIGQFSAALQTVGGEVVRAALVADAQALIIDLVREAGGDEVLAWPDEELPVPLAAALAAQGLTVVPARLDAEPEARRRQLAALDGPAVGITGATAALADTGSLVLLSGSQRPMTASLLPLVHIAVVRERDIVPNLAAFLAGHSAAALTTGRNLVFVTGPSRTADIEMIITRGVHGPKRLVVVLLAEETDSAISVSPRKD